MAKFNVDIDLDVRATVQVEAENLEEAIKKARSEDFELPNLNDGIIDNIQVRFVMDENYNVLEEFE